MALVSLVPRLILCYSSYLSSSYSVMLGSYMHKLVLYPCYVDMLSLYARMLVIYPCYRSIGLYALMCAFRPCYSIYFLCVHTMYMLVDLCHGIGSMAMSLVAPAPVTIARDGWSVVNNASVVIGLLSFVGYGFAQGLLEVGVRW